MRAIMVSTSRSSSHSTHLDDACTYLQRIILVNGILSVHSDQAASTAARSVGSTLGVGSAPIEEAEAQIEPSVSAPEPSQPTAGRLLGLLSLGGKRFRRSRSNIDNIGDEPNSVSSSAKTAKLRTLHGLRRKLVDFERAAADAMAATAPQTPLLLDPSIRDWVVLPMVAIMVLMNLMRH